MDASPEDLNAVASAAAKEDFAAFVQLTKDDYEFGWFNELLCQKLEQFYEDYEAGKNPRLMILAPPRSGKSELTSLRFPAWLLGKRPDLKFIACSYTDDLAADMSREVKAIINDDPYQAIFPDTCVGDGVNQVKKWKVSDYDGNLTGGGYQAAGIGSGITGKGMDIGIIDDPVKNYAAAASKSVQKAQWQWWNSTFLTRRNPKKHGIILIMTRWHVNDLGGQILKKAKETGEKWDIISFPMVAKEREKATLKDGRRVVLREAGEILFPARMPLEFVESCRLAGGIIWDAMYQQNPKVEGGAIFQVDAFRFYDPNDKWLFQRVIMTGDTAQKTGEENDFSVFQLWGIIDGNIYLIDLIRGKWTAPELLRQARAFWGKWSQVEWAPTVRCSGVWVEDKSSGTGLIQQLQEGDRDRGLLPVPCTPIPRNRDKYSRALDVIPKMTSGLVHIPSKATWLDSYLSEFEGFTADDTHEHDDQIDPTIDAIEILLGNAGGISYGSGWK